MQSSELVLGSNGYNLQGYLQDSNMNRLLKVELSLDKKDNKSYGKFDTWYCIVWCFLLTMLFLQFQKNQVLHLDHFFLGWLAQSLCVPPKFFVHLPYAWEENECYLALVEFSNHLPLQNERKPSDLYVLAVQSITPLYGVSRRPAFNISSWFWTRSFTRSIGAAAVLEMIAAAPLSPKFSTKWSCFSLAATFAICKRKIWRWFNSLTIEEFKSEQKVLFTDCLMLHWKTFQFKTKILSTAAILERIYINFFS